MPRWGRPVRRKWPFKWYNLFLFFEKTINDLFGMCSAWCGSLVSLKYSRSYRPFQIGSMPRWGRPVNQRTYVDGHFFMKDFIHIFIYLIINLFLSVLMSEFLFVQYVYEYALVSLKYSCSYRPSRIAFMPRWGRPGNQLTCANRVIRLRKWSFFMIECIPIFIYLIIALFFVNDDFEFIFFLWMCNAWCGSLVLLKNEL